MPHLPINPFFVLWILLRLPLFCQDEVERAKEGESLVKKLPVLQGWAAYWVSEMESGLHEGEHVEMAARGLKTRRSRSVRWCLGQWLTRTSRSWTFFSVSSQMRVGWRREKISSFQMCSFLVAVPTLDSRGWLEINFFYGPRHCSFSCGSFWCHSPDSAVLVPPECPVWSDFII